jgi:site-specific DNA-methyltransferase (adenine-specific)
MSATEPAALALDYQSVQFRTSLVLHADCFEWMSRIPGDSLHAIVTDPPYGVKEYDVEQMAKRASGQGGIWRIPPSLSPSCGRLFGLHCRWEQG